MWSTGVTSGGGLSKTYANGTNKSCSVELLHSAQSWIVDSNAQWSGNGVRRYNRGIVRWPAWSAAIQFEAVCTAATQIDCQFAVVVDGVLASTVTVTANTLPQTFRVTGLPAGSVVEVWEPWCSHPSTFNAGIDEPVEGGYVTAVYLPPGQTLARAACGTGIITVGDSISGVRLPAASNAPECYYGPAGQLRLLAQARGWLLTSLDYGGACVLGDGLTSANFVAWIQSAVAAMGNPATVKVIYLPFHNDWGAYGAAGVSSTPTACGTFLQAIINGLPSYQHVAVSPIPALSEVANTGGFTLGNYRTPVAALTGCTFVDSTTFGINTSTDLADGVHMNTSGVAKYVAGVRGSLGL